MNARKGHYFLFVLKALENILDVLNAQIMQDVVLKGMLLVMLDISMKETSVLKILTRSTLTKWNYKD